jgi:ring-1,2-phenylacetyl-CoA epoxidase subunit PaaD
MVMASPDLLFDVRSALAEVADPEIPVVSIIELGMLGEVHVGAEGIAVTLLPTFIGCPALDIIRTDVERRLSAFDRPVHVRFDFTIPWTSDRITPEGRVKLRTSGFAPPGHDGSPTTCPHCGSADVVMDNLFGPTRCRSLFFCKSCRQPFEQFKTV